MPETVSKIYYLQKLHISTKHGQHITFVGEEGSRVRVPFLTAVASSSLLATAIDSNCSCVMDVVVILPGFSTKIIEKFVDFIVGESIYGNRHDMLQIEELCFLFGIQVQLNMGTEHEDASIDCAPQHRTLETPYEDASVDSAAQHRTREAPHNDASADSAAQHHTLEKPRDVEVVYVNEEMNTASPSIVAHELDDCDDHGTCEICQKRFCRHQLERHECISANSAVNTMQNVSQESEESCLSNELEREETKRFKCKYCNRHFQYQCFLERHERSHTGDRPYHCQYCNKGFSYRHDVVKHERIHTGEKPYKCNYCCRAFTHRGHCKTHELIHTGDKPLKCKYCSKSFRSYSTLRKHTLLHTGERPYKCTRCDKGFIRKDGYRKHELWHNQENILGDV